jgi:hypothetical protein
MAIEEGKRMKAAYQIDWTEYERGWGTRPCGATLHKDKATADQYIKDYWARQPDKVNGRAPDDYEAPGTPRLVEITDEQEAKLESEGGSYWLYVR